MKTQNFTGAAAAGALILMVSACASTISPPPVAQPDPALLAVIDSNVTNDCNPQTAAVLTGLRLPPGNIRGVNYGIYRDMFSGEIVRWDAWVYLKDQPGALVVTLDEECRPIQVYAREGAKLPGGR